MSANMKLALTLAIAVGSAAGCDWTEFDTLSNTTWAHSTTKPAVSSSDWGVAMAPAAYGSAGGELLVIGVDTPTFSTLNYTAGGDTSLGPGAIDLNTQFAINTITEQPLLLSDPSGTVALIVSLDIGRSIVVGGTNAQMPDPGGLAVLQGDPTPQGATFFGSGASLGLAIAGKGMVGAGSAVSDNFHVFPISNPKPTSCTANLVGDSAPLDAVALAAAPTLGSAGAVVAWNADGNLVTYDLDDVVNGCGIGSATVITAKKLANVGSGWDAGSGAVNLGFAATQGEIALIPGTGTGGSNDLLAVIAGHAQSTASDAGELIVFDLTAGTIVGTPTTGLDGLRGFALGTLGTGANAKTYVALGFPQQPAAGTDGAGQVQVFLLDPTTPSVISATAAMTLFDDQPDTNEQFGRALTIMDFNGSPILVVGASNEVFAYYETQVYPDTRQ